MAKVTWIERKRRFSGVAPALGRLLGGIGLAVALGACATIPVELRGDAFAPIAPSQAVATPREGAWVRWGGEIADLQNGKEDSCLDVIGRPLDDRARPIYTDETLGRFRACAPGFYDPDVYAKSRLVTVVGSVEGEITEKFDEYELRVPVVAAETIYLWPPPRYYAPYPYPYPYGPWWPYYGYPYGPYFGLSYGWPYYGYPYPWVFP